MSIFRLPSALMFGVVQCLTAASAGAEAPSVKTLFPAGGRRGETVEVAVSGKLGARPVGAWSSVPGVTVEVPEKGETVKVAIVADAPPGPCFLRFHNALGASDLRPFIIGTLEEVAEKEPNNRLNAAQTLPSSRVVVNGRLEKAGDVDAYTVNLKKGQTLVAATTANRVLGSPMDGLLQIVSAEGFVLVQNDDAPGMDPRIVFEAPTDGAYHVRTFAFPAAPNSTVRFAGGADYIYRLTITTGPYADHAVPLTINRNEPGEIELHGWNLTDDLRRIPGADVLNAPSNKTEPASDAVTISAPALGNTLSLAAGDATSLVEREPNGGDSPADVEPPVVVTGRIGEPGDVDVYRFIANKGQKVDVRVESNSLGFPLDAVVEFTDDAGKVLKHVDDPKRNVFDAALVQTIPADGPYRIRITDLFDHGGPGYVYRLTIAPPATDFKLSVKADRFTIPAGKPLEIPVAVARDNGYSGRIEFTVAGLPNDVKLEAPASEPKGDSAKAVKLKLTTARKEAFSGPIRIVGRSTESKTSHAATFELPGLSRTTADLWLTIPATGDSKKN